MHLCRCPSYLLLEDTSALSVYVVKDYEGSLPSMMSRSTKDIAKVKESNIE